MEVESKEEAKGKEGGRRERRGGGCCDSQMIGKIHCSWGVVLLLPPDASQYQQQALSNRWVLLNRVKDSQKRKKGNGNKKKKKKNKHKEYIQSPAERGDLSEIQRSKNDCLSPKTLQLPGTKARADR